MTNGKKTGFEERFEKSYADIERVRYLNKLDNVLVISIYIIFIICVVLLFIGGYSKYVLILAPVMFVISITSKLIDKYIKGAKARAAKIIDEIEVAEKINELQNNVNNSPATIPLTAGFLNLAGPHMDKTLLDDALEMSKIFKHIALGRKDIPKAQVLFVYANISADGSLGNADSKNARQLAEISNASIVIIATPNKPDHIKKAISLPGPKIANIVFTFDRNGTAFIKFFKSLFLKMREGKEMMSCWVEMAPQGPQSKSADIPVTVLAAEAGKIAFPT